MTARKILALLPLLLFAVMAEAGVKTQKFFNLTADEVRLDSVLPFFSCHVPLDGAWQDSVYTVTIEYPEFIGMAPPI